MQSLKLSGSFPAIVTPMKENGDIDYAAFKSLIEWHITEGTNGLVVLGTTGEAPTVDCAEFEKLLTTAKEAVAGRIPIIAGTGSNCTRSSIAKTKKAFELGMDAALLVMPYYNKPTQEGMYQHCKAVAEAVPEMPIILYNVPGRTVVDLLPETAGRLAQLPNVVGTKEASGKIERYEQLRKLCGPDFMIFTGEDYQAMEAVFRGACGVISVTANVAPGLVSRMIKAAIAGNRDEAAALDAKLQPLHKAVFLEPSPAPAKWLLSTQMKMIEGGIRLPLLPATDKVHAELVSALEHSKA